MSDQGVRRVGSVISRWRAQRAIICAPLREASAVGDGGNRDLDNETPAQSGERRAGIEAARWYGGRGREALRSCFRESES